MGRALEFMGNNVTVVERYPSFEGSNIATGIGFKHIMYMAEEAAVQFFRARGLGPQFLYETYGLGLEVVHSDVRLLMGINLDDLVRIEVRSEAQSEDSDVPFSIQMFVPRGGKQVRALSGSLKVLFRQEELTRELPAELFQHVTAEIDRTTSGQTTGASLAIKRCLNPGTDRVTNLQINEGPKAFIWKRRIPYSYCHYGKRLQHSGYLRLIEEVVDLFLADRGLSIQTMLERKHWIPIVTQVRMEMLREAFMEEDIYTSLTVESIFKNFTYTASVECYVQRAGELVHTATGRITHAYLELHSRHEWSLVGFDDATREALGGAGATN